LRDKTEPLDLFFHPASIAVVGATPNKAKGGYSIIANLLDSFDGTVWPVNPGRREVLGVPCHPSVKDLPGVPDLAIIFVPASEVPAVVRDCAAAGVKAVLIESGGFSEVGEEGAAMQEEMVETARRAGMRLWGPNCTGLVNTHPLVFTPFMRVPGIDLRIPPGNLAILAQSGMMAAGFMIQYLLSGYFKVSKACAIGNKCDIDETDVLAYLGNDDSTEAVVMYLESIVRGREFLETARRVSARKPLVMIKSGRNEQSARAALSHTGSLAGEDEVVDGALRQAGIMRVDEFADLMALGKAFSLHPRAMRLATPEGNRLAVITVTGGGGVVMTDLAHQHGLRLADLQAATLERLQAEVFPPWMGPANPVDIWPSVEQLGMAALERAVQVVLLDPGVDGVLLLPFASRMVKDFHFREMGEMVRAAGKAVVSWVFGDVRFFGDFTREMEGIGIPVYNDLRTCSLVMQAYLQYARFQRTR
jgi:acyl-CoA synthetase (NDP forming)